jgi:hypothetical protein
MKNCSFENYFVEYVSGELDNNEIIAFQSHLKTCPTCAERFDDFYEFHSNLKSRKRKKPKPDLITEYHKNLSSEFPDPNIGKKWSQQFEDLFQSFFWPKSLNIRIAEVLGLILIGVLIGWLIFYPQTEIHRNININPNYFHNPISRAEVEYINYYFQAAELLLLEIKNIDLKSPLNKTDIEFNKNIAQKLLIKTFIINEIALQQNDPKILRFLSKMELLLYEVANVPSEELSQSIDTFNLIIDNSRLLDDARKFQKDLTTYQQSNKNYDSILKENEGK